MNYNNDNTSGYTDQELKNLNEEFELRYGSGEWETRERDECEKIFSDEVAKR